MWNHHMGSKPKRHRAKHKWQHLVWGWLITLTLCAPWPPDCASRTTQVLSRQGDQPKSHLVRHQSKRARQQDPDAQSSITPSIPRPLVTLTLEHCSTYRLHPRFSGQNDELDEPFDKPTGWLHSVSPGSKSIFYGCFWPTSTTDDSSWPNSYDAMYCFQPRLLGKRPSTSAIAQHSPRRPFCHPAHQQHV